MAAAPLEPEDGTPDPFALVGSQAAKYGGGSDLLYDQFELFSCERMRHQIVLLKDCIRNIKLTFNKEFDEVLKLKEAEIKRIKVCTRHGESSTLLSVEIHGAYVSRRMYTSLENVPTMSIQRMCVCTSLHTYVCTYNVLCLCVVCIQERNVRIAKIVSDLKLPDMVVDPYLDSHEDPEQLLVVDPSEVRVEKYISEEEAKRLEEEARLDEEKKAAERVSP